MRDEAGRQVAGHKLFVLDVRHVAARCDASPVECDDAGCRAATLRAASLDDVVLASR
jgi:hypothetical protein